MGFYFRKSKSFGPFRINLSKSGIGLSTGVKGARLSIGPKGTYVNMGRNGMYYRKKLGSSKQKITNNNRISSNNAVVQNNKTPNFNIGTNLGGIDGFENQVLKRIKSVKRYTSLWNIFFWITLFFGIGNPYILIFTVALAIMRIIFKDSFVTEINCDLEDDDKKAWDEFISALNLLKTTNRFWLINSISKIYDSKNNFGTSNDVARTVITKFSALKDGKLSYLRVKSNCTMFQINDKDLKILFLPELLIISSKKETSIHTYNQFNIFHSETRFVENPAMLPKDAEVLDWKYQHVNKDGSMNLRYKYNPKYPVCKYGVLSLSSPSGLLINFELSNAAISEIISNAFDKYVIALNTPLEEYEEANKNTEAVLQVDDATKKGQKVYIDTKTDNELIENLMNYTVFEEN